jgi:hypothetical protein
MEIKTM